MLRKRIYTLIFILLALALVSCGSSSDEATVTDGAGANSDNPAMREISTDLQLMMGTVLLDKTDDAIDADQAAELLPLWKVLNSMAGSETAAQVEVDAVIASIQDAMTPEQMTAIEDMDLTMADLNVVFQILGIDINGGGFGQMTEEQQATMEAMRDSGDFPQGGPGGGPGMGLGGGMGQGSGEFGGNTGITPEMRETAMAERGNGTGRGFGINTQLLEAIIAFLEAK